MPDDLLINFLNHYGQNLTEQARQGRLRKAYGREAEVEAVLRRLARPRDARPLLVGPPHVGKTAIIHEVVRRMVQGDCPESLRGVQVYELAPPQIVTALGTEWRDQLHGFLRDLGSRESTLIYFRDFPTALGAGVMGMFGGPDLATLLAQHLRGESLRCIAEARTNPMRRLSDILPVMDEVFTHIPVEEPTIEQTAFIVEKVAEDLESVLELIVEEGETQLIGEAARRYRYLLRELPRAELDLLLIGPWDTHDAFLTIRVAPDDTDAAEWAESLARMYLGWAGRRRFETTVIDETRDHAGHLQSFAVAIRGHGAFGLLKGETGAHRRLQHREDGGRQALHARVEVVPDIGLGELDAIPPDDVRVQSQAVSGRGKFMRRLRSRAEATHLPSETVVPLTNDRAPDESSELCRHLLRVRLTYEARVPERPAPLPKEPFWGAVVRTYSVYKDQYVKDTRTGITETHIRRVLEGQIDSFLEAYLRAAISPETGG